MKVSFNCCEAGFEGDKVTQVLKVGLLQISLFLYVCISTKTIPKTLLREALDILLKRTRSPLINTRKVCKTFGI